MTQQEIQNILYRLEEDGSGRDSIGNFESQHCPRRWESPLYYPVISQEIIRQDPSWLSDIHWPQARPFAACLTHDVDTLQIDSRRQTARCLVNEISAAKKGADYMRCLFRALELRKRPKRIDIFTPWVELEQRYGFHSSFLFSASNLPGRRLLDNVYCIDDDVYYKNRYIPLKEVIGDIYSQGFDIGLHGSMLSGLDYDLLAQEKHTLETALGAKVYTVRHHQLQYDAEITPALQEKAGFCVDSTLGFNRDIGFRAGIAYPFRMRDVVGKQRLGIFQVPLALQDGALLRPDNLDLDEKAAFGVCKKMIDRVIATKGVVTLLWHPDFLVKPDWRHLYEKLLAYINEQGGWGASLKEIYDWWTAQGLAERLEKRIEAVCASSI